MDCLEPFVKIAKPLFEFALKLSVQHLAYILHYRQKVDELNGSVENIRLAKQRVDHQRGEAEKNLHNIEAKVTEWFQKVDEFETKVVEFGNDEGHTKTQFHYFWNRYRLAKQAQEMAEDVKKLIDELPKFDEVAYRENVTSNDATLCNVGFVEFGSAKSIMEDIMAQLEDSTVRMIGLYGPGGVGKSTLIKEIAKKARDEKLFNVVVKVEITANPNPQKIQEEIAYVLGLRLEGESENVRADCLRRRLKREKENTLVILDDLWDKLDLNKLGIPLDDDDDDVVDDDVGVGDDLRKMISNDKKDDTKEEQKDLNRKVVKKEKLLGDYKGCKILLTSRYKKVLSDHLMNDDSIFTVRKLDDKDALMLFQKVAGIPDEMSNSKQEIVKKYCAGLPMAIITVARALREKSDLVWEATLETLKKQELVEVQNSMEISVKMSYDHLENEELKSIFLLCAQMGHQPLIMDLVKYCFGLGILEGVHSLEEARERIRTSIQKLKDSTLMLDVSSNNHFNMHDMVRDAALSIAQKEQNVFTLRNGKLDDWPELERCTSIFICNSDIIDEIPNVLNCPQLKFFQIDSDDPSLKIPDNFFREMKKLRVLILTGIDLTSLPSSIKCLSNLRMLCLERCTLDSNLSIVGGLRKLRILSFSGSQIRIFPTELGCLNKLQSLDISNCSLVEMIQPNVISMLTCLEELYIRKSLIKKLAKVKTNEGQSSFLAELKSLHQLKVVDLSIPFAAVLPNDLFFDKLNDYKIAIGDFKTFSVGDFRMPNKYENSRSLALQLKDGNDNIHSQKGIKLLFKRVENLLLGDLGVENVIYELNLDGFPDLKHLSITNNTHIKYIINSKDLSHPREVFPDLESLCLYKLRNIEMICCSPVTDASFTKLKSIKVKMCAQLKNLLSIDVSESNFLKEIVQIPVNCLANLEIIDISESNSLKEIVEIPVNCDKVQFLKLHSLTLQLLPSLTSFYTRVKGTSVPHLTEVQTSKNDHIVVLDEEDKTPLFGELVEIPNLESLNLSSINVHKIWNDKPLSSFCFKNLIKLVVKECNELRYLCSLSVASGLNKLKGLFISECLMMEKLFNREGNSADKVCVFPKLEEIHLSKMKMLTEIWQPEVNVDSFSSLISVQIEMCEKLEKIFPCHMEGWFASLDSLKVVNCKSVEVIFEIEDPQQIDTSGGIDTNLQHIVLDSLPNLKQVWSTDPGGILNFKKLQGVEVSSCDKLCNVFPASVAKDVEKLEHMLVQSCKRLVEIVACEDESEVNNGSLVFPELINMRLYQLSNIKHFYRGTHPIECPKLRKLAMVNCEELQIFQTETNEITNEEEKVVILAEKIIPNLEYMQIHFDELQKWLLSNTVKYQMYNLKELSLISVNNGKLLNHILYRMPILEKLELLGSKHLFEESSMSCSGSVLQLKELILTSSDIDDLGFELDPVLQRLELLSLEFCYNLIKLAPPSVSLTYLTYLEVKSCGKLKNLMASSTAKSLVQLLTMKIINCGEIKEIVTNEGNEKDVEIIFCKLITVELVTLKCLTSFCSYKSCKLNFPSLEILIVRECPMMETFSESPTSAPKLQNILAVEGEGEAKWQWEGDLNATLQKVFNDKVSFTYTKHLNLYDYSEFLEPLWHHNYLLQENSFRNLKKLNAYRCNSLVHVIPSHLLPFFENLEQLQVQTCGAAKTIFNINDETRKTKASGIIRLKELSLYDLPKLEHVWDKDPEGIIGLKVLQDMCVQSCDCLKSLFPASVAKDLTKLEVLEVTDCRELVEIFSEDEKAEEGETKMFVFSCLSSLTLKKLRGLRYFYPKVHTLEWPVLEELDALDNELVTLKYHENHLEEQFFVQMDEKVIQVPSLNKLSCGFVNNLVTWYPESSRLKFRGLRGFLGESDGDSGPLYRILDILPNTIEKLAFDSCWLGVEEMFSAGRPDADYTRILLHLKGLKLCEIYDLENIGLEHSWLQPFSRNLQTIQVKRCNRLVNLVPRTVSFSNLTYLEVSSCRSLFYLFTSSTAKSLTVLKKMEIKECESLKEIVSREGDESDEDKQIIFEQLQVLYLKDLPELRCFYPGNFDLCFPSLEKVYVIDCSWMKTFSPVNTIEHSVNWFSAKYAIPRQECDLNSAVRTPFDKSISEYAQSISNLGLDDSSLLSEIWHELVLIPDLCFSNLLSLTVSGCQVLSEVLPFQLLPLLAKLENLEVRNCDNVKTIFDVKCITLDRLMTTTGPTPFPLPIPLRKLTLSGLPKLENVWNEDPHGILSMQLLEEVQVKNCKCLTSVFPTSVARDLVKLGHLVVEDSEELMAIVAEDNADPEGTNLELTFPCPFVKSLEIQGLPKFKYFYYRSLQYDMVKTITHLEPHAEDQVGIEKCLTLGENGLKLICCGEFQRNLLQELKLLTLFFHIESYIFPYEILQQVPNIEKLVVCGGSFKEIFCLKSPNVDDTGFLSQLKLLRLESLPKLASIGLENSWIEPFLKNLETLQVISCFSSINLVPCTVSFSNLTFLEVVHCNSLLYLFTTSTAKSLAQLKRMEIRRCDSIEVIVSKEGDISHEDEITFQQMNCLNLEYLENLRRLYRGSLSFPSLEQLSVKCCERMETLCVGTLKADKLNRVKLDGFSEAIPLETDLKSTMQKAFLARTGRRVSYLELHHRPELEVIWHRSLSIPDLCFSDLVSLIVDGCQYLLDALPFNFLSFLTQLETLKVRNCYSVKTIFDVKCVTQDREMTNMGPTIFPLPFYLKNLTLSELPNLENVWNEDPHGILSMQLLQQVSVDNCNCLTSVFPASVAKDLAKLEKLVVEDCEELMTIVAEDNVDPGGTNLELSFPCMVSLTLWNLPKCKYFYYSLQCDMPKTVTHLEPHTENQVSIEKLTPNLEHLTLGENEMKVILHGEFQGNLLHKLKVVILLNHIESNVFAYGCVQQVPNIDKLEVSCYSFKVMFCYESFDVDDTEPQSQLKVLTLDSLPEPFLRNLEFLEVSSCSCLRNLAPFPIRFLDLRCLFVSECHQLENLFTSSIAKSLYLLKIMEIKSCESIKEIVSKEGDEPHKDEIIFEQLLYLNIESLPNLTSFYKGSLSFPSLVQLSVINCHNMENLCEGTINADKLLEVKFQNNSDAIPLEVDLNSTIRKTLNATAFDYLNSSSSDTNEDSEYGDD